MSVTILVVINGKFTNPYTDIDRVDYNEINHDQLITKMRLLL